jgi:hypothetical protein
MRFEYPLQLFKQHLVIKKDIQIKPIDDPYLGKILFNNIPNALLLNLNIRRQWKGDSSWKIVPLCFASDLYMFMI